MQIKGLINRLVTKAEIKLQSFCEVGRFDGIIIVDLRSQTPYFRNIILSALGLIKATDARRLERIKKYLGWIANHTLTCHGSAEYQHRTRTCAIDFNEPEPGFDEEFLAAWYACILVHEATHGAIFSRGIPYNPALRSRIERLCVMEEQRFVSRLKLSKPELADRLHCDFDASHWERSWNTTRLERFQAQIRRILLPDR